MLAVTIALSAQPVSAEVEQRSVIVGMHARMLLGQDVQRISVGNPRVLSVEVLSGRELLALGRSVGRTNLLIWYADGVTEELRWIVQRDLSLLRKVVQDINPGIAVESAPDRDAIILRGTVPDVRYSRLAEAAAVGYLRAGRRAGAQSAAPSLPTAAQSDGGSPQASGPEGSDTGTGQAGPLDVANRLRAGLGGGSAAVINLIQVGELPATLEERILDAIRTLGGADVTVRRIVRGEIPSDTVDTFVLEGEVGGQVALSRVLIAASTVVTGRSSGDIQVLANEAGALGSAGVAGGTGSAGFGNSGRGGGTAGLRVNQVRSNIGRATAVSAAGGRILAFVHVRDLPKVRVKVRVFEVNRTRLKDWLPTLNAAQVDPEQSTQPPLIAGTPGTSPDFGQNTLQATARILQGVLQSQWEIVAGDLALDVAFSLLETEGLARSLARPTLIVLSGESAVFNVGGAIPIDRTVTTAAGNQNFSDVFFQEFGITLAVRPLVGEDDMITMDVSPDISFPDATLTAALEGGTSGGASTTAFETRTLSTSTRLADGDVLVIGGLLQQQESVDSNFTPGAHQAPGVGWLAKSLARNRDETEVVLLLAPAIVRDRIPGVELWAYSDGQELLGGLLPEPTP